PVSPYVPLPIDTASVVFARTSEPPCFSVMAMPNSAEVLPAARVPSYSRLNSRGFHRCARAGEPASAGTTELVIEIGQAWPGSTWANNMNVAARATLAPGLGSAQAEVCAP